MEESGHYYTVYFISLAVGFRNNIARQHAFFTQMPDEVEELDAYTLHMRSMMLTPISATTLGTVDAWRLLVEQTVHALTGGNPNSEQERTRLLLSKTDVTDYIKLGLLLHRYGDSFAHVEKRHPNHMYRTTLDSLDGMGHGLDGHSPDHPWERETDGTMKRYLEGLFSLFTELANRSAEVYLRNNPRKTMTIGDIHRAFRLAISKALAWKAKCSTYDRVISIGSPFLGAVLDSPDNNSETGPQRDFIASLRTSIMDGTGESFDINYHPESIGVMTWQEFQNFYGDRLRTFGSGSRHYTAGDYEKAIGQITVELATTPVKQ